jgi:hypothetical protein
VEAFAINHAKIVPVKKIFKFSDDVVRSAGLTAEFAGALTKR